MRAGARRHRLIIQRPVPGIGWGAPTTWATHTQLWGSMEPLRGDELMRAQQINSQVTGRTSIPFVPRITPAMRFLCDGRVYQILAVIDPELRHRELQLLWREESPT